MTKYYKEWRQKKIDRLMIRIITDNMTMLDRLKIRKDTLIQNIKNRLEVL